MYSASKDCEFLVLHISSLVNYVKKIRFFLFLAQRQIAKTKAKSQMKCLAPFLSA